MNRRVNRRVRMRELDSDFWRAELLVNGFSAAASYGDDQHRAARRLRLDKALLVASRGYGRWVGLGA